MNMGKNILKFLVKIRFAFSEVLLELLDREDGLFFLWIEYGSSGGVGIRSYSFLELVVIER